MSVLLWGRDWAINLINYCVFFFKVPTFPNIRQVVVAVLFTLYCSPYPKKKNIEGGENSRSYNVTL